ncbi:hypothetical protein HYU14_06680 [Candidatus Woesearchaeota archaeon]|nr:hypothetical protein [Candidatus Woesearchaeota archaeon]
MDIFSWIFKNREAGFWLPEKHLPQVKDLRSSIGGEINLFHEVWKAHEAKAAIVQDFLHGNSEKAQKELPKKNSQMKTALAKILELDSKDETIIRKILFEAVEKLHEAEAWVWRYGKTSSPSWSPTERELSSPQGRRTPYGIETKKRAVWALVQDKQKLADFIKKSQAELKPDFEKLEKCFTQLREIQVKEIPVLRENALRLIREEDELLIAIRGLLSSITNKLLNLAQEISGVEIDEQKIKEDLTKPGISSRKRIGVMLIHGITSHPQEMDALSLYLRGKLNAITYVVRLPGHGRTLEEFALTPIAEIESFMIQAYKYFYQYMKSKNDGDGRFYTIGLSIGAMMQLHIMAKTWGNIAAKRGAGYPYQAMVKGMVSMAACIVLTGLGALGRLEPLITGAGSSIMMGLSQMNKKGGIIYNQDPINNKILGIKEELLNQRKKDRPNEDIADAALEIKNLLDAGTLNRNEFRKKGLTEIPPLLESMIELMKKEGLSPGDLYTYANEDLNNLSAERQMANWITTLIIKNIEQGKRPISTSSMFDIRALINRRNLDGHAQKALGALSDLMMQLREDVKKIKIPICVIQGMRDTVSHPKKSGEWIYNNVQTPMKQKRIFLLKNTGHIPTRDFDKKTTFVETARFIQEIENGYASQIEKDKRDLLAA